MELHVWKRTIQREKYISVPIQVIRSPSPYRVISKMMFKFLKTSAPGVSRIYLYWSTWGFRKDFMWTNYNLSQETRMLIAKTIKSWVWRQW